MSNNNSTNSLKLPSSLKLPKGTKLLIATHNGGKLAEFKQLFAPFGLDLVSAAELGLKEPEETGMTFIENARLKAHTAARASGLIALADDSGLCVDALDGRPGVHTADWAGKPRDFNKAMQKVEDELIAAGATDSTKRKGAFFATLCLALPDGNDKIFVGEVRGEMVWPPRGELGFGFDPTFMPDGFDITFGQMDAKKKHSWQKGKVGLSHRARAFALLVEDCCDS